MPFSRILFERISLGLISRVCCARAAQNSARDEAPEYVLPSMVSVPCFIVPIHRKRRTKAPWCRCAVFSQKQE